MIFLTCYLSSFYNDQLTQQFSQFWMPQIASTRSLIYRGNKSGDLEVLECISKMIFDIYLKVYVINHTVTLAAVFECYFYNLNQIARTDCYHTFALTIERFTPQQTELINVIVLHFIFPFSLQGQINFILQAFRICMWDKAQP